MDKIAVTRQNARALVDVVCADDLDVVAHVIGVHGRSWGESDDELRARLKGLIASASVAAYAVGDRVVVKNSNGTIVVTVIAAVPLSGVYEVASDYGGRYLIAGEMLERAAPAVEVPPEHVCPVCDGDARTGCHAPCSACKGSGSSCADCKGTGEYVGAYERKTCPTCEGQKCEPCGGSGW